jgi:hypothetical protein
MRLDETSERNAGVIRFVRRNLRGEPQPPPIAPRDAMRDPYQEAGSHPDAVERLWDGLGNALPADCRCLVYGAPALVHPTTGAVLAFSMGTGYFVRLPSGARGTAPAGTSTDDWRVQALRDLGGDWIVGSWSEEEAGWCFELYEELQADSA